MEWTLESGKSWTNGTFDLRVALGMMRYAIGRGPRWLKDDGGVEVHSYSASVFTALLYFQPPSLPFPCLPLALVLVRISSPLTPLFVCTVSLSSSLLNSNPFFRLPPISVSLLFFPHFYPVLLFFSCSFLPLYSIDSMCMRYEWDMLRLKRICQLAKLVAK